MGDLGPVGRTRSVDGLDAHTPAARGDSLDYGAGGAHSHRLPGAIVLGGLGQVALGCGHPAGGQHLHELVFLDPHAVGGRQAGGRRQAVGGPGRGGGDGDAIHQGELRGVVLQAGDFVVETFALADGERPVEHLLALGDHRPLRLGIGGLTEGRRHGDGLACTCRRGDGAGLNGAGGQPDRQIVGGAGFQDDRAIQVHGGGSCRGDAAPIPALAQPELVSHPIDVPGPQDHAFQGRRVTFALGFELLGHQDIHAHPARLALGDAPEGGHLDGVVAVPGNGVVVLHILDAGLVAVVRVHPADQGRRVAGLAGGTAVGEPATLHIRVAEERCLARRGILYHGDRPARPVGHAPEHRGQIREELDGVVLGLQVQGHSEARFLAALAVAHQLIAGLAQGIEREAVNLPAVEIGPGPPPFVRGQCVPQPCRVIGPGHLHGAVPDAHGSSRAAGGVGSGLWIIVRGHFDQDTLGDHFQLGDAPELLRIHLEDDLGRIGGADLAVEDLGVGLPEGVVAGVAVRRVRPHAGDPQRPGACSGRVHPPALGELALERAAVDPAIALQGDHLPGPQRAT